MGKFHYEKVGSTVSPGPGRFLCTQLRIAVSAHAHTGGVATVMGMDSLLGCETARRLTGAGPEETGKEHTQGSDGFGLETGFVPGTVW